MSAVQWLGQATDTAATAAAWEAYVRALSDNVSDAFQRATAARASLKRVRERLGLPFFVEQSGEGQAPLGAWGVDLDQQFKELGSMVATLSRFADEAVAGKRRLGTDAGGQLGLERLDSDLTRIEVRGGRPVEVENATNQPVRVTGTVSALPALLVGVIVVAAALATYFAVAEVCETVEQLAEQKTIATVSTEQSKQLQAGATPEQVKALTDSVYEGAAAVHEARAVEQTAGRSEIPQTIRTVGFIALGLAALYIVAQLVSRRGGGGAMVPARLLENAGCPPGTITRRKALAFAYPGRDTGGWDVKAPDRKVDAILRRCRKRDEELLENPIRRSGDVRVNIRYRDREDDYAGTVTWPGGSWRFDQLRLSPFLRERIAVDSSQAYDEAARAAISFGADEHEDIYGYARTDDRGEVVLSRR